MKTKPALELADVKSIAAAAEAEALKHNWAVSIAIVDDGGHLLSLIRGDGAPPVSAEIAEMKAHSAAVARRSTKVSEDRIASRPALVKMPVLPVQGGVPILHEGQCVGGIGVSGVASHEDEQVANAGLAALGAK